jgi:oligoribonuclease NrnB/cAMP/cGMP phosphodiesterase (DHH superfamily)
LREELRSKLEEIEKTIFTVFTVNWDNLTDNKFEFMNQLRVSTDVIDKWPYYEFEKYIKRLNEKNENEKKHHEDQERDQQSQVPNVGNMSSLAKSFNPSSFKLPSFKSPF